MDNSVTCQRCHGRTYRLYARSGESICAPCWNDGRIKSGYVPRKTRKRSA